MEIHTGETWRFQVECPGAERVYLVRETEEGSSTWIEMHASPGSRGNQWEATHHLSPGRYRFRYFRADGSTYLNCGSHGLLGERVGDVDPQVSIDELQYAVPA